MDLTPGRRITDRNYRIDDAAGPGKRPRVVFCGGVHDARIRQGDLLPESRPDARGKGAEFDYRALAVSDAHVIAPPKRLQIHQDEAAERLADYARSANGN